ncbi:MAG: Do family serine endopeptidase [bacterium]
MRPSMIDPLSTKARVLFTVTMVGAVGLGIAAVLGWASPSVAGPAVLEQPQVSQEAVQPAADLSRAFVEISQAVTPAVVRIEVERPGQMARSGQQAPPLFDWFFQPPGQEGPQRERQQEAPPRTTGGSGFIVSEDGYILTNNHVVSDAQRIRVYMRDGREYLAELVGADPTTDVAVIQIDDGDLPTLSFGSSSDTEVGEWVLAVGNPGFGSGRSLDYTVTAGIVSAIGRPLELIRQELQRQEGWEEIAGYAIEDFIQTDAVINPGNSGGPLVNVRGQVVGINSAIASRTGFYQGYGFAVPIDLARRIMEDLVEHGQVRRPLLGIEMQPVSSVDAEYYGLPRPHGVLVQNVPEDGPAYEAGIRQEDVIVAIDGEEIERPGQLQLVIAQRRPGDEVTVRFYREGEPQEVEVRLGEAELGPRATATETQESSTEEKLGIEVTRLDEATAQELGYDQPGGVVIRNVSPAGPAAAAGVAPGQLLVDINRESVETLGDVERLLQDAEPGDVVSLRLGFPDGSTRIVNLRVPR